MYYSFQRWCRAIVQFLNACNVSPGKKKPPRTCRKLENAEIPRIETVLRTHPPKSNDISEKVSRDPGSLKIVIVVMTVAAGGNIPIDCVLVSMIVNNFAIQNLNSDLQKQNMSTYRLTPKTNTNTRPKRQIEVSEFL